MAFFGLSDDILMYLGVLILIGSLYLAVNFFIDKRYPKVQFLTFKGNTAWVQSYRSDNGIIIEGDFMQLIMGKGRKHEDLKYFENIYLMAGAGGKKTYLACDVNMMLLPMRMEFDRIVDGVKKPFIKPEDVISAQRIAARQYDSIRYVETQAQAQNSFFAQMAAVIPYALIALIFVGSFWFIASMQQKTLSETATVQATAAEYLVKAAALQQGFDPTTIPGIPGYNASRTYVKQGD
jgi:hypothetical protein